MCAGRAGRRCPRRRRALWAGVAAARAQRAPRCPSSRAAGYGWGSAAAATGAGGAASGWPGPPGAQAETETGSSPRGRPGAPWPRPPPAPQGALASPKCTLFSCARADAPGVPQVRLASVGPWRPGERPGGAAGRSPPGRARRLPVSALALRSMLGSALGVQRPARNQPRLPRPVPPLPAPRPPRLSAPPPSSSVRASGGQPPKEGALPAHAKPRSPRGGGAGTRLSPERPALAAVHTGTKELNG